MAKSVVKKKPPTKRVGKAGYFNGKLLDRWDAAFAFRVKYLKKEYISCSDAMRKLRDDAGKQVFPESVAAKQQWILQRRFNQLEADNFKEPTKGEIYVMLYQILYGTKEVITKGGIPVEVDLDPSEKTMIIREILKMGGHYAPEERKLTGAVDINHKMFERFIVLKEQAKKELSVDSSNRLKDLN